MIGFIIEVTQLAWSCITFCFRCCCKKQLDDEINRVMDNREIWAHPSQPSMTFNFNMNTPPNSVVSTPEEVRALQRFNGSSSLQVSNSL